MSIGTIGLSVNWFFEGGARAKLQRLKKHSYSALILASAYLIHLIWLFNTDNLQYASKDLLVKLPLLLIPIVIGTTKPLSNKEIKTLLIVFISGLLISTTLSTLVYLNVIPPKESQENYFQISLFMSHIRMGLLVSFTSLLLFYIATFHRVKNKKALYLIGLWLFVFLFLLQSVTALISWFLGFTIFALWKKDKKVISRRYLTLIWLVVLLSSATYFVLIAQDFYKIKDTREISNLPEKTISGELYHHDTINKYTENGCYVWLCIAPNEVKRAWNNRSKIDIDSTDFKNQKIRYTLYRYLTSLDLNKDSIGIYQLTKKDIASIELGNTSHIKYTKFEQRIRGIFLELKLYFDGIEINGHSVSQRLFFFELGYKIIKENFYFGVGSGDINDAYKEQYLLTPNDLHIGNQMRSHNQFLSYFISYGLIGFIFWLFTFVSPMFLTNKPQPIYLIFITIMVAGFISDDMLERQAGVAIYITINAILLYSIYSNEGASNVLERTKRTPNINS